MGVDNSSLNQASKLAVVKRALIDEFDRAQKLCQLDPQMAITFREVTGLEGDYFTSLHQAEEFL
jgi:hypothetical protein